MKTIRDAQRRCARAQRVFRLAATRDGDMQLRQSRPQQSERLDQKPMAFDWIEVADCYGQQCLVGERELAT